MHHFIQFSWFLPVPISYLSVSFERPCVWFFASLLHQEACMALRIFKCIWTERNGWRKVNTKYQWKVFVDSEIFVSYCLIFFFFCVSFFLFFNLNIYIYLKFLQRCVDFCHIATQISHNYTYIPSLPILPLLPPPIPPGHHRGTRLGSLCYTAIWFFERQTCEIHIWTNDLFGSGRVEGCSCKWRNINFGWKC